MESHQSEHEYFKNDDVELEMAIKELIHNSKKIDASDVSVLVDNRKVTLSGSVKSQAERDYAVSLVKLISGVGSVQSDLVVKLNSGILPTDIGRNPN
jgi:osmotically-inducible protein OsmY